MKHLSIIMLLLIAVTLAAKAQTPEEKLQHKLDSISNQNILAGFGVSVFSADSVLFQKGYGYADVEKKKPYTVKTIQNIGSISKTFTGVALMKLVEMGKLSMGTPINDILPFKVTHPKYADKEITIKHLATHTSGIIDFEKTYDKSYVIENPERIDPTIYDRNISKYMRRLLNNKKMELGVYLEKYLTEKGSLFSKKNFLKTSPGEKYKYSNIATALAAYCVELVSGTSFDEFTKLYIFDKIGMKDVGWFLDAVPVESHAKIYADNGEVLPRYDLITYPDGGLRTNVETLTMYMQEMINCYKGKGAILGADSSQKMMKGQLTFTQVGPDKGDDNYGYYWENNGGNVIGHNGGDPGILTLMYYYKDIDLAAIFFTNTNVIDNPTAAKQVQASWNVVRTYQKEIHK